MQTILFPTDFTPTTHYALEWAKLFARQYKAKLVILHVYQTPLPDTTLPTMGDLGLGTMAVVDLEEIGRKNLENLENQLRSEGLAVQTDWRMGMVEDEIINAASELQVDLIVTGRQAESGFFDRLVGSASAEVARAATCPVLVVPNSLDDEPVVPAHVNQVVYATQLEFDERAMLSQALEVARMFDAELHLVKVEAANQPDLYDDNQFLGQLQQMHGDLPLQFDTVKARSVATGLTDYLGDHPTDLLIMTTRERGFLANLINPSQTEKMVARSHVPVLVLH